MKVRLTIAVVLGLSALIAGRLAIPPGRISPTPGKQGLAKADTFPSSLPVKTGDSNLEITAKRQDFARYASALLQSLPTTRSIKGMHLQAEEVHRAPAFLVSAARSMGTIAQVLAENPEFAPEALTFYSDCAANDDLMIQIRTLCRTHVQELAAKPEVND